MLKDAFSQSAPGPRERWFDLCFRLIILALAGLWLFMPPTGEPQRASESRAAVTQK